MNVFDGMGNYWAEIADKSQTQKQIQFAKTVLPTEGWVLDLACGTARHSIPLTKEGYGMVGLDVSAKLLHIAKVRWSQIQLVRADMRVLPFRAQAFTAALSMDTSLGYLPNEEDDAAVLAETRRVLNQNCILIVDLFNREELTQKYSEKSNLQKPENTQALLYSKNEQSGTTAFGYATNGKFATNPAEKPASSLTPCDCTRWAGCVD